MDQCSRCNKPATEDIWCAKHYAQWLTEWACECGEINGGSINDLQSKCGWCHKEKE